MMHIKVHIMTELLLFPLFESFWHNDFFSSLYLSQEVRQWNEAREIRTQVSHKDLIHQDRIRRTTCSYFTEQRDNWCVNERRRRWDLPSPVEPVASLEQCVSCLCISCFETRLEWHEEIIQSFLQVALSWAHQDEGCCCNTVSGSVVVSRSVLFELELVCVRNFVYVHEVCPLCDESSQCLLFMSVVVDDIQIQKQNKKRGNSN